VILRRCLIVLNHHTKRAIDPAVIIHPTRALTELNARTVVVVFHMLSDDDSRRRRKKRIITDVKRHGATCATPIARSLALLGPIQSMIRTNHRQKL
jgi:hypothetical protein